MLTLPIYIDVENKINNFIKDSLVETECDKSRVHKLLNSCLETTEFNKYTIIDEDTTTIDYFDKKYVLSFVTKNYENNRFTENKIIIDKAKNKPLFRLSYTYDKNNNHAKDISYYEVSYTTYIKDTSKIEDKLILRELSFDIRDSVVSYDISILNKFKQGSEYDKHRYRLHLVNNKVVAIENDPQVWVGDGIFFEQRLDVIEKYVNQTSSDILDKLNNIINSEEKFKLYEIKRKIK